jgi:hypothetical protein
VHEPDRVYVERIVAQTLDESSISQMNAEAFAAKSATLEPLATMCAHPPLADHQEIELHPCRSMSSIRYVRATAAA